MSEKAKRRESERGMIRHLVIPSQRQTLCLACRRGIYYWANDVWGNQDSSGRDPDQDLLADQAQVETTSSATTPHKRAQP